MTAFDGQTPGRVKGNKMTDKELRKLHREDLLQILISQQRRIDELTAALEEAEGALNERKIALEESGSIAEAAYGIPEWIKQKAISYLDEPLKDVLKRWKKGFERDND